MCGFRAVRSPTRFRWTQTFRLRQEVTVSGLVAVLWQAEKSRRELGRLHATDPFEIAILGTTNGSPGRPEARHSRRISATLTTA